MSESIRQKTAARPRMKILTEWFQILLGLIVFAFGVHLTIRADIGLGPWDCLGMGISYHTPLNFGLSMTLVSVCLLLVDLAMKEKIGYGTIIDALVTGNMTQLYNSLDPMPAPTHLAGGIVMMMVGVTLMAVGQFLYMRSAHGCGPRDSFLTGLGKRLAKLPIGAVQIIILVVVLFFGWRLGGKVGIGTLINVVGTGLMMQAVFRPLHFEPRKVRHRSVFEISRILFTTHYRGTDPRAYGSCGISFLTGYFADRYCHLPRTLKQARLSVPVMPNTGISGSPATKNCSVAAAARVVYYWKQKGMIRTEDSLQQIYQTAEKLARRHGYRESRGLRAVRVDDLCRDLFLAYGCRAECKSNYFWDFEKHIQPEIDAGRPVIFNIAGGYYRNHTVTIVGYRSYGAGKPYRPDQDQIRFPTPPQPKGSLPSYGVSTQPTEEAIVPRRRYARRPEDGDWIMLTIADGWKPLARYIDLHAFGREFPTFGASSINTIRLPEAGSKDG